MGIQRLYMRALEIYRTQGPYTLIIQAFRFMLFDHILPVLLRPVPVVKVKCLISHSAFLSTIFFYITRTFHYEKKAILHGQARYRELEIDQTNPCHRLNRLTHLLEKGLIREEETRKDVFGVKKAAELVELLDAAWIRHRDPQEDTQLQWTVDVLSAYFQTVNSTGEVNDIESTFRNFVDEHEITIGNRTPRPREQVEINGISYEQFRRLANQRSSTRLFQDKRVPRELLDKAISIAAQSPSACNRQSYEFRIYDDPDVINQLTDLPVGTGGFNQIPCYIVLVGKQRAYFRSKEKNVIFIDASLAAMSFEFALETLGLASCTINWPARHTANKKISRLLDLDPDEVVITTIAVGYPQDTGGIPYSEKKSIDQLRSFNKK